MTDTNCFVVGEADLGCFVRFHATSLGPVFRVWPRLKAVERGLLERAGLGI